MWAHGLMHCSLPDPTGETVPEEQPKPSLLKKVAAKAKAKARKLKTQLMDPNAAQGRTFASHIEDDSDSSSEDRDGLGPGIKFHVIGPTFPRQPTFRVKFGRPWAKVVLISAGIFWKFTHSLSLSGRRCQA